MSHNDDGKCPICARYGPPGELRDMILHVAVSPDEIVVPRRLERIWYSAPPGVKAVIKGLIVFESNKRLMATLQNSCYSRHLDVQAITASRARYVARFNRATTAVQRFQLQESIRTLDSNWLYATNHRSELYAKAREQLFELLEQKS